MANDTLPQFSMRMPATLREKLAAAAAQDGRTVSGMARKVLEGALDPAAPISRADQLVYGHGARRHPTLGFILEDGVGSLSEAAQAENFIRDVERTHGSTAADLLRRELLAAKEQT
jgi:hypothetical protein